MLRAATGLEGGCVASGSTCGVATGGALGIGLSHDGALERGDVTDSAVLALAGEFMDWFKKSHGNSKCRERNGVDFHTLTGQLKYFFSAHKMIRCMRLTGTTLNHLTMAPLPALTAMPGAESENNSCEKIHCARRVLELVRERTGVGNDRLERISVVLDGGVGLKGELCGALAASVMAINLKFGFDIRSTGYSGNVQRFLLGHLNLIRKETKGSAEIFALGKTIVDTFKDRYGSVDCLNLTGISFDSEHRFQTFMADCDTCHGIIEHSAGFAVELIETSLEDSPVKL